MPASGSAPSPEVALRRLGRVSGPQIQRPAAARRVEPACVDGLRPWAGWFELGACCVESRDLRGEDHEPEEGCCERDEPQVLMRTPSSAAVNGVIGRCSLMARATWHATSRQALVTSSAAVRGRRATSRPWGPSGANAFLSTFGRSRTAWTSSSSKKTPPGVVVPGLAIPDRSRRRTCSSDDSTSQAACRLAPAHHHVATLGLTGDPLPPATVDLWREPRADARWSTALRQWGRLPH
jgi:hypothetical protein